MTDKPVTVTFNRITLTLAEAKEAIYRLQEIVRKAETPDGPRVLFEPYKRAYAECCRVFGYTPEQIHDMKRRGRLSEVRAAIAYCFRHSTLNGIRLSLPDISHHVFAGRTHATVFFACKNIRNRLEMGDEEARSDVRRVRAILIANGATMDKQAEVCV